MDSERQYIDLFTQCRALLDKHSCGVLNQHREEAFRHFQRLGFPTRKVERYKYTSMGDVFAPDYGLNLQRLDIPVNPYEAFRCDVPNLSTSLFHRQRRLLRQGPPQEPPPGGGRRHVAAQGRRAAP